MDELFIETEDVGGGYVIRCECGHRAGPFKNLSGARTEERWHRIDHQESNR